MRIFALQQKWGRTWRALACAGLVLTYLGFVGEAIHCQYFAASGHQEHGNPSSKPMSHATHCLVANHGTSATIHSVQVSDEPPAQRVTRILTSGPTLSETVVVLSKVARGPPTA